MLRSEELKQTIERVKELYDYVIVDTSPLGLVADSFGMSRQVDVNLLLVRSGKTNKSFFKSFIQLLKQDCIFNFYLVLNDVPVAKKGLG